MLARRNRFFAAAAWTTLLSTAVVAASEVLNLHVLGQQTLPGGYVASDGIAALGHLVGICGGVLIATAFGEEIDWYRLRHGGAIVVASYLAAFVSLVYRAVAVFASSHDAHFRASSVANALAALLGLLAVGVAVSGLTSRNRGAERARRLWLGAALFAASYLAFTVGALFLQTYWSGLSAPSEITIGTMVLAVGSFAVAAGAFIFVRGARRPLAGREASLFGAAGLIAASTLLIAGGEALIATAYVSPGSLLVVLWLGVVGRVLFAAAAAFLALGARSVVDLTGGRSGAVDLTGDLGG